MLTKDEHKRALDRLESLIDLEHVRDSQRLQEDAWLGRPVDRIPCSIGFPAPDDWPHYPFTQAWDDLEKNFMNSLVGVYCGALVRDDKAWAIGPEYGVVNIPELLGIPSVVTDPGSSMSIGLNDTARIRELISRGVPPVEGKHVSKLNEFYDFAWDVLRGYEKLSQAVHFMLPDTQGPFDIAHLVWGHGLLYAIHDSPELVDELLELTTNAYIQFTAYYKRRLIDPWNSGYHCAGVRLVRGGSRICDDSAVLCSREAYLRFSRPYNILGYAPFGGGWLHYCGNGNHFLDDLLTTPGVNAVHMGNPDNCDLLDLYHKMQRTETTLIWSGSLDRLAELRDSEGGNHPTRLMILTENRYASSSLDQARLDLDSIRQYRPIHKAPY